MSRVPSCAGEDVETCAHIDLAVAYHEMELFQDAHDELRKALVLDPGNRRALYYQAKFQLE